MDNFDIGILRRKIHEFYACKKEIPTVNKLLHLLKEEIGFTGSREILRQHIKSIGFRFRKTRNNRKVLMERNDISAWRARYLQVHVFFYSLLYYLKRQMQYYIELYGF